MHREFGDVVRDQFVEYEIAVALREIEHREAEGHRLRHRVHAVPHAIRPGMRSGAGLGILHEQLTVHQQCNRAEFGIRNAGAQGRFGRCAVRQC